MFELECVGGCGWEEIHRRGFRNRRSDTRNYTFYPPGSTHSNVSST